MAFTLDELAAALADPTATAGLTARADAVKTAEFGATVHLRAIVEFSNHCAGTCRYCGINPCNDTLPRYRLPWPEVVAAAGRAAAAGIRTIILQSGQDPRLDPDGLIAAVATIKERFDVAVTLCCGEWPRDTYRRWREAGADRYLLKIETTDPGLYAALHPGMSFDNRRRCLDDLFDLGYEVGTGNIVGLPGQTPTSLAHDLLAFAARPYDMVAIGPLIPAPGAPLEEIARPPLDLVLRSVALARLLAPAAHIPATSALCALDVEARRLALRGGANVVMIDFTPPQVAPAYRIYDRAPCGSTEHCLACMRRTFAELDLAVAGDVGGGRRGKEPRHAAPGT